MSEEPFTSTQNAWRENHGNFLVGFSLFLILLGAGILAYKQSQTPPPAFPQIIDRGDRANATQATSETTSDEPATLPSDGEVSAEAVSPEAIAPSPPASPAN